MTTWTSVAWTRSSQAGMAAELVRAEVSRLCGVSGDAVRLSRVCAICGSERHGRPVLVPWAAVPPPAVGVSRSPGLTVVVVAFGATVGIDVEDIGSFTDRSVSRVALHPRERADLPVDLATTWVRKEALLKAAGCGLSVDPSLVRLSGPRDPAAVLAWPKGIWPKGIWAKGIWAAEPDWLVDLDVTPGVCAAIAGSGPAPGQITIREIGIPHVTTREAGAESPLGSASRRTAR